MHTYLHLHFDLVIEFNDQLFLHQVRELTQRLGVITDDKGLFPMLEFYHDIGTIIYFGGKANSNLQDMVILNPQWLIDIFKRIITIMPNQDQKRVGVCKY